MESKTIEEYTKMSEEERYDYMEKMTEDERYNFYLQNKICAACLQVITTEQNSIEVIMRKAVNGSEMRWVAHVQNPDGKICMNFLLGEILDVTTPSIAIDGDPLDV